MEAYQEQTASHWQNKYSHNKCITRSDGRACKADGWSVQLNVWLPAVSFMPALSLFQTLKNENNKTSNKNKTLPPLPTLFLPKTKQKKTASQNQRERTGHSRRWSADPMNENCQMIHTLKSETTLILMGINLSQYPECLRQQCSRCTWLYCKFEGANNIPNNGIFYISG